MASITSPPKVIGHPRGAGGKPQGLVTRLPPSLARAGALVVSSRGAHLAAADGTEIAHLSAAGGLRAGVVAEDAAMADVWSTEPRARCRVSLAGGAAAAAGVVSCVEALVAVAGRYLDGVGGAQGAARERAGGDERRRADDAAFEQLWRRAGALALAPRVGGGDLEGISDEHSDSDSEYTSSVRKAWWCQAPKSGRTTESTIDPRPLCSMKCEETPYSQVDPLSFSVVELTSYLALLDSTP